MPNGKIIKKIGVKGRHSKDKNPNSKNVKRQYDHVFVGAGNLGGAVLDSLLSVGVVPKSKVLVICKSQKTKNKWKKKGVQATVLDFSALNSARYVWLGVKPYQIVDLAKELNQYIKPNAQVISLLAGKTPSFLKRLFMGRSVTVVMTHTGTRYGEGLFAAFSSRGQASADKNRVEKLIRPIGTFAGWFSESKMAEVTALVGSSPAFILKLLHEYQSFAHKSSIKKETSLSWFMSISKAVSVLSNEEGTEKAITKIATPGGCTQKGLDVLSKKDALSVALRACAKKAAKL